MCCVKSESPGNGGTVLVFIMCLLCRVDVSPNFITGCLLLIQAFKLIFIASTELCSGIRGLYIFNAVITTNNTCK